LLAAVMTMATLTLTTPGHCQAGKDPTDRFNQGVALAKQKKYGEAAAVWLKVLPDLSEEYIPKAHKALGLAYKKLNRGPEAAYHLHQYLGLTGNKDKTAAAWLEQVEKELASTHVKVAFTCQPDNAEVRLAAKASTKGAGHDLVYACPLTYWLVPGEYVARARAAGFEGRKFRLSFAKKDKKRSFLLKLKPVGQTGISDKPKGDSDPFPILEWALVGSGVALIATGGILHGLAYSTNQDLYDKYGDTSKYPDGAAADKLYDQAYDDDVQPKEYTAYALYGVGAAAATVGAVLLLTAEGPAEAGTSHSFHLSPFSLPGGSGAVMTFEF